VFAWDPEAPPRRLDNEPDQIHADGIQVYFKLPADDLVHGLLIVPSTSAGNLITRPVAGMAEPQAAVRGSWQPSESGYSMTIAISTAGLRELRAGDEIDFDLLVNQMLPDRERRAGQLVWTGGGGWVWLRGDRQDPSRFGKLRLE
jgi:hypothetical protein